MNLEQQEVESFVAIGLTNNLPIVQSTRNKGNVVESVTKPHDLEIPNVKNN